MTSNNPLDGHQEKWRELFSTLSNHLNDRHKSFVTCKAIVDFLKNCCIILSSISRNWETPFNPEKAYDVIMEYCPVFTTFAENASQQLRTQQIFLSKCVLELNNIFIQTEELINESSTILDIRHQKYFKYTVDCLMHSLHSRRMWVLLDLDDVQSDLVLSHNTNIVYVMKDIRGLFDDPTSFFMKWKHYIPTPLHDIILQKKDHVKLMISRSEFRKIGIPLPRMETVFLSLLQCTVTCRSKITHTHGREVRLNMSELIQHNVLRFSPQEKKKMNRIQKIFLFKNANINSFLKVTY